MKSCPWQFTVSVVKSAPLFIHVLNLNQPEYLLSACVCVSRNSRTNSSRKHWVFEKPRLQHTRESPRPQARGHTGVPQVTSVAGPQAETLDRSATSSTDPTAPLFAKSWLPDMGIYTLFMVAQQVCLPLRTDVWALEMQCKAVKFS